MAKNKPFPDIAALIEAGNIPITDRVIGEPDRVFKITSKGKDFVIKNKYITLSGDYIIIARQVTPEEEAAEHEAFMDRFLDSENAEITDFLKKQKPDYILIAWRRTMGTYHADETYVSYWLPRTGARYVYIGHYEKRLNREKQEREILQDGIFRREGRKIAADAIKNKKHIIKDKKRYAYILCAPLWLLTSIPDPRPRYLHPENEEADGEPSGADIPA